MAKLGDAPIEPRLHDSMNAIARGLDQVLNGDAKGADRKNGFVLMVTPRGLSKEAAAEYAGGGE